MSSGADRALGPGRHGEVGRGAWRRAGAVPLACRPPCLAAPAPAHALPTPAWAERAVEEWAGPERGGGGGGAGGGAGPQFQTVSTNGFKRFETDSNRMKRFQIDLHGFKWYQTDCNRLNGFKPFETVSKTVSNRLKWFETAKNRKTETVSNGFKPVQSVSNGFKRFQSLSNRLKRF